MITNKYNMNEKLNTEKIKKFDFKTKKNRVLFLSNKFFVLEIFFDKKIQEKIFSSKNFKEEKNANSSKMK